MEGECKRVMCTIGLRGEPSVDRNNQLMRCARSDDCSQGQMCDPNTHVSERNMWRSVQCAENNKCSRPAVSLSGPRQGRAKFRCVFGQQLLIDIFITDKPASRRRLVKLKVSGAEPSLLQVITVTLKS
ncbi:hypothetical protein OSTOST_23123 [Ostertagia ostertagi]